ncbi:MAG TPA: beta-propeller fold lactonase family protein [Planctomicrobium sp.]|nr:beta-propeller fold lactonase family protein [Planctomicrobium sp.]
MNAFAGSLFENMTFGGDSNSLMDLSTDGQLLACSNRDSGTVTVVNLKTGNVLREIPVGARPEGVTFLGNSSQLAVAVYGDDVIKIIDTKTGQTTASIDVFDEPYSVVSNKEGTRLWATLEYPGMLLEIDPQTKAIVRSAQVGKFLRGLAIAPDGHLFVTEYLTGVVLKVDPATLKVIDEWRGPSQDNLARQIVIHPTWNKAYLPFQQSVIDAHHGEGSIFPYLGILDLSAGEGKRRKRVQLDTLNGVYVVANPWEVAISPDGQRFYVVFSGTDDMYVCDLLDDNYREVAFQKVQRTGSNPRAIKISPDSSRFYIYNALSFTVDEYDAQTLQPRRSIKVTNWTGTDEELLGKKLFYTANPPMTRRRWISCSSCHPDGDPDGRTWQQPEGLRNTQSLFGMKFTHPIHWSADRDEVQDFEHTLRSPLMQGRGLIRGKVNDALGAPNAGLSKELDAVAAYANTHPFKLSPHAKQGLTESAQRGKALFFSEAVGCAQCHNNWVYTDNKMHDVGTGREDKTELMGTKYDTPTLLGIYRTAPYLHDGTAATLEEVLTTTNKKDQHGKTSHLSQQEVTDLVEFLKALPYELPE